MSLGGNRFVFAGVTNNIQKSVIPGNNTASVSKVPHDWGNHPVLRTTLNNKC